jgi:hypothetical protein
MFMYLTSSLSRSHAIKHMCTDKHTNTHTHTHTYTHTHTHLVGLLWMSDHPDAETSTLQHTTLTTGRHPCPRWDLNRQTQQASGRRPRFRPPGHRDRLSVSHQQTIERDPQAACLTQEGLTAILQELTSLRGPACEARDEIRREKEK